MRCEFCNKEVDLWWVENGKWCCKECKNILLEDLWKN